MYSTSELAGRVRGHLDTIQQRYPRAWRQLAEFRARRGQEPLPSWPDWCWVPLAGAYAIVSGGGANRVPYAELADIGAVGALGAWRQGQGIYRFDPDLAQALARTELDDRIPTDVCYRLPEWCVYLATGDLIEGVAGCFVHLEWDATTGGRPELRFVFDIDAGGLDGQLWPWPLHLDTDSLQASINSVADVAEANAFGDGAQVVVRPSLEGLAAWIQPCLALVLYLCADNAEITDPDQPGATPGKVLRGKRSAKRPTVEPRLWEVGYRLGTALRASRLAPGQPATRSAASGRHQPPRPHVRRAHWHTYLHGPRSRPERRLRWLAPIPVNTNDADQLIPVVREVPSPPP